MGENVNVCAEGFGFFYLLLVVVVLDVYNEQKEKVRIRNVKW